MGCYDPFDLTRNDIISDEMVFDNPTLADAFLFDLYDRAQFHIKSGNGNLNMGLISSYGGESRNYGVSWQAPYTQVIDVDYNENGLIGKVIDYYDYSLIRESNQLINRLPLSNNLSQYEYFSRYACNMDGVYMLSMMDHITRRLAKLDSKNESIKTEKKEAKLRFDKKVQKHQGDFVICGDIYHRKRARSCHILSHRVTNRPLTIGKAYEVRA